MMTGRRILVVSDAFDSPESSLSRALKATIDTLTRRGYYVLRVTPALRPTAPVPFCSEVKLTLPPYRIARLLDGVDAVFIDTEGPLGLATRHACLKAGMPFTTAFHNTLPRLLAEQGVPGWLAYGYFRWFHRHSHAVLTPTRRMRNSLVVRGLKNVKVWGRGVDTTIFKPRPLDQIGEVFRFPETWPRPYWLHVGRVARSEDGLCAFCKLDLPGTKIVIGDGPDRAMFEAMFPNIQVLGDKDGYDRAYAFNQADVFVASNRKDRIGLVNFEAVASGVPVAAYPVAATLDVVEDGVTGVLDEDLKSACERALALPRHATRVDFSWDGVVDRLLENLVFVR